MENIPYYIGIVFAVTTLISIFLFYRAARQSKTVAFVIVSWLLIQAAIGLTGFYTVTDTMPPRFLILISVPVLMIVTLFITRKGRAFLDMLDLKYLTLLHVVRIPVELILLWLAINKTVPFNMTFEGSNWDILSGISAAIIYYFMFVQKKYNRNVLLIWNFICLGLLINIVVIAILSAPFPFQRLSFDQPNRALMYFPYIWLPAIVVPIVLISHLASIRKLLVQHKTSDLKTLIAKTGSVIGK